MRAALLLITLLLIATPAGAQDRAIPWQGSGADGHAIRFDPDHLQRPAVLLFWATWCSYCKALMPHLQAVYDAAGNPKLDVYAIDIKDDGDPVAELRERGQTFTLIREGDPIADLYGVKGTPSLLLIDRTGNVIYKRVGGDAPEKVEAMLRAKLGLPAPARLPTHR
jgi:cytochrome c biogenesis protein CcmG/thiol:disulfide interchange protein DsbE